MDIRSKRTRKNKQKGVLLKTMKLVNQVWKVGTASLVLTIDKNISEIYGVEEGDVLEIEFDDVKIFKKKKGEPEDE